MKIINSLTEVIVYIGIAVVAAMMLLTVADVSGRYFFSNPVTGTTEVTEFLMVCLLLGMVPCALARRHIRIDIFFQRLRPRAGAILEVIYYIITLGLIVILTWLYLC